MTSQTEALREALYQTLKMETIPKLYTQHKVDDILRLCDEHDLKFTTVKGEEQPAQGQIWHYVTETGYTIIVEPLEVE